MATITEDYVSYEVAKLLKEKCYCNISNTLYKEDGEFVCYDVGLNNKGFSTILGNFYEAPTLQMAMKWLREVHGLFIRITEDMTGSVFEWSIYQKNYGCRMSTCVEDSYEQACEAAIKYCLEILIGDEN